MENVVELKWLFVVYVIYRSCASLLMLCGLSVKKKKEMESA